MSVARRVLSAHRHAAAESYKTNAKLDELVQLLKGGGSTPESKKRKVRTPMAVEETELNPEPSRTPTRKVKEPPYYDGKISFRTYLVQLVPYLRLVTNGDESQFVDYAVALLKGEALDFYADRWGEEEREPSWQEFKETLLKFCTVRRDSEIDSRLKLATAFTEPNATLRSILELALRVKARCAGLDDLSAITLVLTNCEPELVSKLRFSPTLQADFTQFDVFVTHALALFDSGDPIAKRIKQRSTPSRFTSQDVRFPEPSRSSYSFRSSYRGDGDDFQEEGEWRQPTQAVPLLSQTEKERRRRLGLCFLCGVAGHTGDTCPERKAKFGLPEARKFRPRPPTPGRDRN